MLAKALPESLPSETQLATLIPGEHLIFDRDEVHDIYAEWRALFEQYDPPLTAVAEAWVLPERRARYASQQGLGQAFNFDLLRANWDADEFREVIERNLRLAAEAGSSSTWTLSNHDVVRHATRYGLPQGTREDPQDGRQWLRSGGREPSLDRALGLRRARAATLLLLALPGSTYLFQGEELGLHEVPDLPEDVRQDPTFLRTGGAEPGRDGCRVPLPWSRSGPSLGFGDGSAHLPQPAWFAASSVEAQQDAAGSTLELYRQALALRRGLPTDDSLVWHAAADGVLHFEREGGWHSVTNFGSESTPVPPGQIVVASAEMDDGVLPPNATAWILRSA